MVRSVICGLRKFNILGCFLGIVLAAQGSAKAATNTTFDVLVVTGSLTAVGSTTFQGSARFLSSSTFGGPFTTAADYSGIARNVWNVVSSETFVSVTAAQFTNLSSSGTYEVICQYLNPNAGDSLIRFNSDSGNKYYYNGYGMESGGATQNYNGSAQSACVFLGGTHSSNSGSRIFVHFYVYPQNPTNEILVIGQATNDATFSSPTYYPATTHFGCYYAGSSGLTSIYITPASGGTITGNCRLLTIHTTTP